MSSFEKFLQQKGFIPSGIARYQREVNKYANWLKRKGKNPETAEKKDLLDYLHHLKETRHLTNASQNNILKPLKNYYAFLAKQHGINNITHFIKIRGTQRKHLPPLFTPDELDLLCDVYYCHIQEYKPNRKELYFYPQHKKILEGRYIALTLMAYQALTLLEILALKKNDFNLRKATVTIRENRRGAERKLPLHASQIGAIIHYFADEEITNIIPNLNHFERFSKSLKKLHPKYRDFRQIRASKITHWLKLYGLRKAQYLAGHRTIHGTEKYLAGEFETLQNDLDHFHPLN